MSHSDEKSPCCLRRWVAGKGPARRTAAQSHWAKLSAVGSFAERFQTARSDFGPLVWGLDPSRRLLQSWGLDDNPDGLDRFVDVVLDAAVGTVGLIKPQAAFYERHGWRGFRSLCRLISDARHAGLLVILDAKRGDVASTNEAYAESYLAEDAPVRVDALTVHPYLGFEPMDAFVEQARRSEGCLLVVVRSSNPEGRALQSAVCEAGGTVESELLRAIGARNADLCPGAIGPIGAVIGPTHIEPELDLRSANALFLAPGVGAQGASPEDVAQVFGGCPDRVMPSASRLLLEAGPDVSKLRYDAQALANRFKDLLSP
jgi:orotidine-5'-phosphate decarboxylase